jgi:hypothetical protein
MAANNLQDKLVRVERTINVYTKDGDESLQEIPIDNISFEKLKDIVPPKEDDPLLYDGYILTEEQLNELNKFIERKIKPDFGLYTYILVCGGIYNW